MGKKRSREFIYEPITTSKEFIYEPYQIRNDDSLVKTSSNGA